MGKLTEWDLKVLLDMRKAIWMNYDNISFLCGVHKGDQSTPSPKPRKLPRKNVDDKTNNDKGGSKRGREIQKGKNVEASHHNEIRVFLKIWLEVCSLIAVRKRC